MGMSNVWVKRAIRGALISACAALLAGIAGSAWLYATVLEDLPRDLTSLEAWRPPNASEVVDAQGRVIDTFYVERRFWVDLQDLPPHVWQSFIAAEDKRFFSHPGVDAAGVLRALVANLRSGSVQGGSTLTQQLVKNLLLTSERSYRRKIREAWLAYRLEQTLDKTEILELYVNFVYLGSGNYGVEAAARDYFGVSAAALDPGQAALIAGLVPAPSRYNPRRDPDRADTRRALVIRRMVDEGFLDPIDALDFLGGPVLADRPGSLPQADDATAYVTMVRREVRRLLGHTPLVADGLRVQVPYDAAVQRAALQAVSEAVAAHTRRQGAWALERRADPEALPPDPTPEERCFQAQVVRRGALGDLRTQTATWALPRPEWVAPVHEATDHRPQPLQSVARAGDWVSVCRAEDGAVAVDRRPWAQAAAAVVENASGRVVAITGADTLEGFVEGAQARRQPGSSFKPYVFAAALSSGRGQLDTVQDAPLSLPAGGGRTWTPKNYGGGFSGPVTLRSALARSLNTPAVRLAMEVGPKRVAAVAGALGVATTLRTDLAMALGASEVTPLDQAVGYAALARMGVPIEPTWIDAVEHQGVRLAARGQRVRGAAGARLPGAAGARALPASAAYQVVDMMREVVQSGTARRARLEGADRAGKTGTTNGFVDAWFVGSTPSHTIAVWVGADGGRSLGEGETGGRAALPAWLAIADVLPKDGRFAVPDEIVVVEHQGVRVGLERGRVPAAVLRVGPVSASLPEPPRAR